MLLQTWHHLLLHFYEPTIFSRGYSLAEPGSYSIYKHYKKKS